jgi:hypothetical protein
MVRFAQDRELAPFLRLSTTYAEPSIGDYADRREELLKRWDAQDGQRPPMRGDRDAYPS